MSIQRGLAKVDSPEGLIVAFATQAGRTAEDGSGRNSPYTTAFLKHIESHDEIGTIFRRIAADVYETTKHAQLPELSLSPIGEYYLLGQSTAAIAPPPTLPVPPALNEVERAWAEARDTKNQAVLEQFIERFGDGFYAALARARLEELRKNQTAALPPPLPAPVHLPPPPTPALPSAAPVAAVAPPIVPLIPAGPCGSGTLTVALSSRPAQPLSTAEECALKPKDVFRECDKCPEMVVVPAGSFTMGSPRNEKDRDYDEGPQLDFGQFSLLGKPRYCSHFGCWWNFHTVPSVPGPCENSHLPHIPGHSAHPPLQKLAKVQLSTS